MKMKLWKPRINPRTARRTLRPRPRALLVDKRGERRLELPRHPRVQPEVGERRLEIPLSRRRSSTRPTVYHQNQSLPLRSHHRARKGACRRQDGPVPPQHQTFPLRYLHRNHPRRRSHHSFMVPRWQISRKRKSTSRDRQRTLKTNHSDSSQWKGHWRSLWTSW